MREEGDRGQISPPGAVCMVSAVAVLACALPWPWQVTDPRDPLTSAALMAAAGVVWVLVLWGVLLAGTTVLARSAGWLGTRARAVLVIVTPHALRGLLVTAVGVGAGVGLTGPALAADTGGSPTGAGTGAGGGIVVDVDWPAPPPSPDWPGIPSGADPTPAAAAADEMTASSALPTAGAPIEHVVLRGDTLWSIAARHLPAGADAEDISASWPQWYAANRDVIGPDPGLILPGQRLLAPALDTGGQS